MYQYICFVDLDDMGFTIKYFISLQKQNTKQKIVLIAGLAWIFRNIK